jgi:hypothetical protein
VTDTNSIARKSRRDFLAMLSRMGIGGALVRAAPLAGGLLATRAAHAQNSVRRVVFVYTPNGAPNGLWLPDGATLNLSTQAYEGLQSLCNFREVEVIGSGHGLARKCLGELRWTSDWTGDTIDQQIASVIGVNTPYPSYTLGVQTNPQEVVGRKAGDFVPAENSPAAAYAQLFGSAPPAGDASGYLARKQSVMDINRSAVAELKGRLGSFERETLEKHEAALLEIEARLVESVSVEPSEACTSPAWNANGYPTTGPIPGGEVGVFAYQAELHADIITAAFQCGLTNVFTLQLGWHQGEWYAHDTQYRGNHHGSCHAATAEENAEMTNYLSRCVAYLVRRLVGADDPAVPGTKLIDNTVVVQVTDMGNGQDHSAGNGPNMIATRMPGFKQGTVSRGGNNYEVLEAVVEGMGLGQFKGTDANAHKIWPCAGGSVADDLLA